MLKIWSELPGARLKEQVADLATLVWVVFWGSIVWQLFQFLASFAEAGRTIRAGGDGLIRGGRDLGDSLAGLPLVGSQVRDIARDAIGGAGRPLVDFGTELEQFIFPRPACAGGARQRRAATVMFDRFARERMLAPCRSIPGSSMSTS